MPSSIWKSLFFDSIAKPTRSVKAHPSPAGRPPLDLSPGTRIRAGYADIRGVLGLFAILEDFLKKVKTF